MGSHQMSPQELVMITDRAVLPAGREVDLPISRARRYVVIEGEVLLPATEARCGPGVVLEPTGGRLRLRALAPTVLGVMDAGVHADSVSRRT